MAKISKKSATSKKLEALARAQKISELLKYGSIQSQALLDSAGETTSTADSHVVDLLSSGTFGRASETTMPRSSAKRSRPKPKAKSAKKSKPKKR